MITQIENISDIISNSIDKDVEKISLLTKYSRSAYLDSANKFNYISILYGNISLPQSQTLFDIHNIEVNCIIDMINYISGHHD